MAPSAPSFGHRPSSASRHFDALSMRANRLDPTPVGRLELPNNSPHKQLDAKYGVGLLSATDLRMLGGEADGAAHHVPRAGMTQLADRTAAQLLWKTSHAAAHPPTKKKGRGAGASDSKRGSKDHDHALHNTPGHITGFTVTSIPKNFDESVSSVEELRAAETAAAVASAKAVRARAHRGAVPPPKVGVGTGFAYTPEVVMPRFQVTSGKGTPGGLLSAEYADAMAVKQAVRDGDDVRKMRVWRRQRARDVEMLDDLAARTWCGCVVWLCCVVVWLGATHGVSAWRFAVPCLVGVTWLGSHHAVAVRSLAQSEMSPLVCWILLHSTAGH